MIRGKVLFVSLIAMGILAALLGVLQLWTTFMADDTFLKSMITILVLGTLSSFLMAVDYDLPGSKSKTMLGILVVLSTIGAALILLQMWWELLSWSIFGKLMITIVIIGALVSFILVAHEDFGANKKLKDDNYID